MEQKQPQEQKVYIEGRFGGNGLFLVFLFALIFGTSIGYPRLIQALGRIVDDRMCVSGLSGYSAGSELYWATYTLGVLVVVIGCVSMMAIGWRIRKQQRNIPLGCRPWFKTELLEGQAAIRQGTWIMIIAMLALSANVGILALSLTKDYQRHPLVPPVEIAQCQSSQTGETVSEKPEI